MTTRTVYPLAVLLAAGCPTTTPPPLEETTPSQSQSASCAAYLACLEGAGSPNLALEQQVYGPDGECWAEGAQEALACTLACDAGLAACEATTPTTETGTTPTDTADTGTGTDCEFTGATVITTAYVSCDGANNVTVLAETTGWVLVGGDNSVFMIDTASSTPWSESHPIDSNGNRGKCGVGDELELVLDTNTYPPSQGLDAYDPGVSSFYSCGGHFTEFVMTYAIAIVDADGNYADCLAFGEDPNGLVDGDYDGAGASPEMDLSLCVSAAAR